MCYSQASRQHDGMENRTATADATAHDTHQIEPDAAQAANQRPPQAFNNARVLIRGMICAAIALVVIVNLVALPLVIAGVPPGVSVTAGIAAFDLWASWLTRSRRRIFFPHLLLSDALLVALGGGTWQWSWVLPVAVWYMFGL